MQGDSELEEKRLEDEALRFTVPEVVLLVSISLIWVISIALVAGKRIDTANVEDLLFGAASVALFIFSFLVAILAIFGWQTIQQTINERVDARAKRSEKKLADRVEELGEELNGRLKSALGYLVGEISYDLEKIEPTNPERLEHAIELCEDAVQILTRLKSKHLIGAENNLIFLTALAKLNKAWLLSRSEKLKKEWEEQPNKTAYILTYSRVVLQYSEDPDLRRSVKKILEDLKENGKFKLDRKEAKLYLDHFFPPPPAGQMSEPLPPAMDSPPMEK